MKNFIEELKWRGMLAQVMPGAEELLQKEMVTAYLGTDPTADSLHIGHLCGIMMLRHLQRCGHKPIILVGGATGMIGDPSGKSQERNLLDAETLYHNQECIKKQVSKFIDFEAEGCEHPKHSMNCSVFADGVSAFFAIASIAMSIMVSISQATPA